MSPKASGAVAEKSITSAAVTSAGTKELQTPVHNCVQSGSSLPATAVLYDCIKPLETSLQRRGMLGRSAKSHYPLWFLAETERNVFLWRNGLSVLDADHYEFWIDLVELIDKRIGQLTIADEGNPFLGGIPFEEGGANLRQASEEEHYLNTFLEKLTLIVAHAHALSFVGSELGQEFNSRQRILLPCRR